MFNTSTKLAAHPVSDASLKKRRRGSEAGEEQRDGNYGEEVSDEQKIRGVPHILHPEVITNEDLVILQCPDFCMQTETGQYLRHGPYHNILSKTQAFFSKELQSVILKVYETMGAVFFHWSKKNLLHLYPESLSIYLSENTPRAVDLPNYWRMIWKQRMAPAAALHLANGPGLLLFEIYSCRSGLIQNWAQNPTEIFTVEQIHMMIRDMVQFCKLLMDEENAAIISLVETELQELIKKLQQKITDARLDAYRGIRDVEEEMLAIEMKNEDLCRKIAREQPDLYLGFENRAMTLSQDILMELCGYTSERRENLNRLLELEKRRDELVNIVAKKGRVREQVTGEILQGLTDAVNEMRIDYSKEVQK